jgi:hypothetical protein
LTAGESTVRVAGSSVREVLEDLERNYPGLRDRLCAGDGLRPGVQVSIDGRIARLGLRQAVEPESEVLFGLSLGGGD